MEVNSVNKRLQTKITLMVGCCYITSAYAGAFSDRLIYIWFKCCYSQPTADSSPNRAIKPLGYCFHSRTERLEMKHQFFHGRSRLIVVPHLMELFLFKNIEVCHLSIDGIQENGKLLIIVAII